jgi:ribosomal RNA assembly protein
MVFKFFQFQSVIGFKIIMQQVFITAERLKSLRKEMELIAFVQKLCKCKIKIESDGTISITADDGYSEFVAKNILFAYGRGFDMQTAELLEKENYYFISIDVGQLFGSEKRIMQMKARIIGENGRTKIYIENVSGAKLSIYGDTISFIGSQSQIDEAKTAVSTLLDGGTHKLAYARMEAAHRKNKAERHNPTF